MNVWLVIANPYAYDRAMWRAISEAQNRQTQLQVVFFIRVGSVGNMIHELSETGWLGAASLRSLKTSLSQGYRALADDVLKRVQRKATQVETIVEGVVEKPSLEQYIHRILAQGAVKVIIAGSKSLAPKLEILPETVEYFEEE